MRQQKQLHRGSAKLGTAALEREQRDHVCRPRVGRHRYAGIDLVRGLDLGAQLALELVQPVAREDPGPSSLDTRRLAVQDKSEGVDVDGRVNGRGDVSVLHESHPLLVTVARRSRVDDAPAAERRLGTQDHAVATGGDDGLGQSQLRPALTRSDDASESVRCPDMNANARAVANRLELVEHDVEPVRDG